jgi:hypothetical protein
MYTARNSHTKSKTCRPTNAHLQSLAPTTRPLVQSRGLFPIHVQAPAIASVAHEHERMLAPLVGWTNASVAGNAALAVAPMPTSVPSPPPRTLPGLDEVRIPCTQNLRAQVARQMAMLFQLVVQVLVMVSVCAVSGCLLHCQQADTNRSQSFEAAYRGRHRV